MKDKIKATPIVVLISNKQKYNYPFEIGWVKLLFSIVMDWYNSYERAEFSHMLNIPPL